jgi:thiamine-phosphate pyrophosphorylase
MQLIAITPDRAVSNETEIINSLFENGLPRLHIRKAGFSVEDYRSYLKKIDNTYHPQIALHGAFELINEFHIGGFHLNSSYREDKQIWEIINALPRIDISTSFHSWQEIIENTYPYKYVFISPVFDSISKKDYKAGIDLSGAMAIKNQLAGRGKYCPGIIALGGVEPAHLKTLHENGFDGAAILGAIWDTANSIGVLQQSIAVINSLSIH